MRVEVSSGCCEEAGQLNPTALWEAGVCRIVSMGLAPAGVCLVASTGVTSQGKDWVNPGKHSA